jgi:orotate phosphoribosyltransferase
MKSKDTWQVLHLSDLHVTNPAGGDEQLREAFFDEYITKLADALIGVTSRERLMAVVTGDFVDRGAVQHFGHARRVLEYLAEQFGIAPQRIAVCIGNHDVVQELDRKGHTREARKAFRIFSESFANKNAIESTDRGALIRLSDDAFALMIDATLGSRGEDIPGTLEEDAVDKLVGWIKKHVPREQLLVVGSHYPVDNRGADMAPFDHEIDFAKRHIWDQGAPIRERVQSIRIGCPTLWLSGDIHRPVAHVEENLHHLTVGRLGTRIKGGTGESQVRRQVALVKMTADGRASVALAEYASDLHKVSPHTGEWRVRPMPIRRTGRPRTRRRRLLQGSSSGAASDQIILPPSDTLSSTEHLQNEPLISTKNVSTGAASLRPFVEILDVGLQREILDTVRERQLYHFGRFAASDAEASLAWVSIGPLLNEGEILSSVVRAMSLWIEIKVKTVTTDPRKSLLIGADCWGAVLASQLSVTFGVRNYCLATRARGAHNIEQERVSEYMIESLTHVDNVFVIADVVRSGRSIAFVREALTEHLPSEKQRSLKWFASSVICDETRDLSGHCAFLSGFSTACGTLKMPGVNADSLPPEDFLPSTLSFI